MTLKLSLHREKSFHELYVFSPKLLARLFWKGHYGIRVTLNLQNVQNPANKV